MKIFIPFSILFGVTFLFSCSHENQPVAEINATEAKVVSVDTMQKSDTKVISAGEKIYHAECILCHGIDGKKKHNEAKDLSISTLSVDEAVKLISSAQTIGNKIHAPRFPAVLSAEEIRQVAQYILTLRR